jgi:predicted acetyltransferase
MPARPADRGPHLEPPTTRVRASYLAAITEFRAEGRHRDLDRNGLADAGLFRDHVEALVARADPEAERPPGYVPETVLWWVHGHEFLGRLSIRHRLTPPLARVGGHIGYEVRPSARRRGHATAMLRAALPIAARLGIDPALVTCDVDNVASRLVIEHAGGRMDGMHDRELRLWVPTR